MLGNGRPSGTGIGEKGDTDRGLLPLTDQQFRHRRKLHNGFKVLITQTFTLNWLYMMERCIDWHEQGIPVLALRYEELNAHREEVLSQVFEYCDLPVTEVQKALEAFSEDAHEGTPIERARPDEEPFRLSEEQVDEVVRVLARHPVINTSDFLTPGMLKL